MFPDLSHLSGHMYEWAAQMSENGRWCGGACPGVRWGTAGVWWGLPRCPVGHGRGMVGPARVSRGVRQGCGEVWAVR